jgi:hypothetical protein
METERLELKLFFSIEVAMHCFTLLKSNLGTISMFIPNQTYKRQPIPAQPTYIMNVGPCNVPDAVANA